MDLTLQCRLFLHLFMIGIQLLRTTNSNPYILYEYENCHVTNLTIDSTFNGTANCQHVSLHLVNITEPSQKLFDRIAIGLHSLHVFKSLVHSIFLPRHLITFHFTSIPGLTTEIIIEENATYKLENIALENMQQLPVNINKLRSLRQFEYYRAQDARVDFGIFADMMQLERITLSNIAEATIPDSLYLPSLRILAIYNSSQTIFNGTTCNFPKLDILNLYSNNLTELPQQLSNFAHLTYLTVQRNKLPSVSLDVFANMDQLTDLRLSGNEISEIIAENPVELPRLRALFLNNNNLTVLNVSFWIMPALENLSLSNNQLKQVAAWQTLFKTKLQALSLFHNPWDCEWLNVTLIQQMPNVKITISRDDACSGLDNHVAYM